MDTQFGWLLNLICYLPLVGALFIIFFIKKENTGAIKTAAVSIAAIDFVLSLPLWFLYRTDGAEFQFATQLKWIPSVGVQYLFGVDGFAVLLILLTTLLGFISVYSSFSAITDRVKEYYGWLLVIGAAMVGVFLALLIYNLILGLGAHFFFAEVAPKTVAAHRPEPIAFTAGFVLEPLLRLFYPIVWFINTIANVMPNVPVNTQVFVYRNVADRFCEELRRAGVVATMRGFHGRTFGALSATWDRKHRGPFEPLVPGVRFLPHNDLAAAAVGTGNRRAAAEPRRAAGGPSAGP